jgi:hypothetical protein
MNAQWHLFGGRRQMHRAYAPFARWGSSQQARRPPFMTGAELSGPASHRIRASVKLTHPCQFAAAHLPCTRPPDVLYGCRPRAHPGLRDRALARAFVVTRAGTDTMPTRRDEDEIPEDAASATARCVRAPRFGTRAPDSMTPPAPERPATPDDLRTTLGAPTSYGVKLFEVIVLQAILKACPDVKDAGDLLILRETLLEDMGPAYMWLINLSLVDWLSLSADDKTLNAQMRLDWLASYTPCRTRAPLP